jgi:hypothetical protein
MIWTTKVASQLSKAISASQKSCCCCYPVDDRNIVELLKKSRFSNYQLFTLKKSGLFQVVCGQIH